MKNYEMDKILKNNDIGSEMFDLIERLFPICRSITGNGVRQTLKILQEHIPLKIFEVPSGMKVFDWVVPEEWNISDAYIKNSKEEKIVDFKKSNLHVMSYSIPVNGKLSLSELKKHLFTLPDHPNWIPYRTSYYEKNWGFCVTKKQYDNLKEDQYTVVIDSKLEKGSLTYGEYFIKGEKDDEVIFSCYICHPSMCNDNLSGVSLVTFLAKFLKDKKLKYSYRFLFMPETIGAITWLSLNEKKVDRIKQGLIVTCVGDRADSTYKKSKYGNAVIDRVVQRVLQESMEPFNIVEFFPFGSDERQFSSPGINLPFGSLMRTPYHKFPQYHTSADNMDFIFSDCLKNSLIKYYKIITYLEDEKSLENNFEDIKEKSGDTKPEEIKEENSKYVNCFPKCEPNLGKRGLYRMILEKKINLGQEAIFWILSFSDGKHSIKNISEKSKISYSVIKKTVEILTAKGLIKKADF